MKQQSTAAPMIAFARLMKVDEEKRLVYGRAAQEVPDRAKEKMDYDKSKPYFEAWSKSQMEASMGKSAGNIRGMHGKVAAGIVLPEGGLIFNDAEKAVDIVTHVVDDAEWKKVQAGAYTGFSIGGKYISKSEPDPKTGVVTYVGDISEISLVDRPALPTATFFEVQKADGTVVKQEFAKPVVRKMIRRDGTDLSMEVLDSELPQPGEEFMVKDQRYMLAKVENGNAYVDEVYDLTGSPEELANFAKLMGERGLTIASATTLLDKAAPAKRVVKDDDADVLGKAAQIAHDKDKVDFTKLAKEDPKRAEYVKLAKDAVAKVDEPAASAAAKKVFADEKNNRFPIDTAPQIKAAWEFAHMAKGYDDAGRKAVLERIQAAAKEKEIALDPVEKLQAQRAERIEKAARSLYEPADAELKAEVIALEKADGVELEKIADTKAKAAKLEELSKKACGNLYDKLPEEKKAELRKQAVGVVLQKGLYTCASFTQLLDSLVYLCESVEYEADMEGDNSDVPARLYTAIAMLGDILVDMVAEEVGEATGSTAANTAALAAMQKLAKAKETHKAVPVKYVQKMHDTAIKMGASCEKSQSNAMTSAAALEAAVVTGDLKKRADGGDELAKALLASNEALTKANEALTTATATNTALGERVKKLEAQPMPARVSVRAISKEADGGGTLGGKDADALARATVFANSIDPVRKSDGSIDEVATATKIMRAAGGVQVLNK